VRFWSPRLSADLRTLDVTLERAVLLDWLAVREWSLDRVSLCSSAGRQHAKPGSAGHVLAVACSGGASWQRRSAERQALTPGVDASDYVESLWDQVVEQAQIPVPEWHLELLRERLEAFRSSPSTGRPWKEVREELRRKYLLPSDG
jgi:hypothetical protein